MRRVVCSLCSWLITLGLLASLLGCEFSRPDRPSVLVLAVEGLGADEVDCDQDGHDLSFCEEAVRFTHAYSPSTMSQATLASILTGLYPLDHNVRHNGQQFLSARFRTASEEAVQLGFHTFFVSGGPPIWRKSGLAQGFAIFDDALELNVERLYRPAHEVVRLSLQAIEQPGPSSFFGVLFFSDLQFPNFSTATAEGEMREASPEGQRAEIFESLELLFKDLKKRRIWNSTHIILLGLNAKSDRGSESSGDEEPPSVNLKSSGVQVTLMIKPARRERDNIIQWAIDRNVSLVDVGRTMFEWLGAEPNSSSWPQLEVQSLSSALDRADPQWREDRLILSESAWPDWRFKEGVRLAVRQEHFVYIHDKKPLLFNTLTDRMEKLPLRANDPLWQSGYSDLRDFIKAGAFPPWEGSAFKVGDRDLALRQWQALVNEDWKELATVSRERGDPVGLFVAARRVGGFLVPPKATCLQMLFAKAEKTRRQQMPECEDEALLTIQAWVQSKNDEERATMEERLIRIYSPRVLDHKIARMNQLGGLTWDSDPRLSLAPLDYEFVLYLREFENLKRKLITKVKKSSSSL